MKRFQVIEEGRLSKSELSELLGGIGINDKMLNCQPGGSPPLSYYATTDCWSGMASLSACPFSYLSCNTQSYTTCTVAFTGPTGPGGYQIYDLNISPLNVQS